MAKGKNAPKKSDKTKKKKSDKRIEQISPVEQNTIQAKKKKSPPEEFAHHAGLVHISEIEGEHRSC